MAGACGKWVSTLHTQAILSHDSNPQPFHHQATQSYTRDEVVTVPSVLSRCWLGSRKGIRHVKTEWWGAGVVVCLERGANLHMAQLMPLPFTVSRFSKIQIGSTFLVPTHPGSPGQRAVKRARVCEVVTLCFGVKRRACVPACRCTR